MDVGLFVTASTELAKGLSEAVKYLAADVPAEVSSITAETAKDLSDEDLKKTLSTCHESVKNDKKQWSIFRSSSDRMKALEEVIDILGREETRRGAEAAKKHAKEQQAKKDFAVLRTNRDEALRELKKMLAEKEGDLNTFHRYMTSSPMPSIECSYAALKDFFTEREKAKGIVQHMRKDEYSIIDNRDAEVARFENELNSMRSVFKSEEAKGMFDLAEAHRCLDAQGKDGAAAANGASSNNDVQQMFLELYPQRSSKRQRTDDGAKPSEASSSSSSDVAQVASNTRDDDAMEDAPGSDAGGQAGGNDEDPLHGEGDGEDEERENWQDASAAQETSTTSADCDREEEDFRTLTQAQQGEGVVEVRKSEGGDNDLMIIGDSCAGDIIRECASITFTRPGYDGREKMSFPKGCITGDPCQRAANRSGKFQTVAFIFGLIIAIKRNLGKQLREYLGGIIDILSNKLATPGSGIVKIEPGSSRSVIIKIRRTTPQPDDGTDDWELYRILANFYGWHEWSEDGGWKELTENPLKTHDIDEYFLKKFVKGFQCFLGDNLPQITKRHADGVLNILKDYVCYMAAEGNRISKFRVDAARKKVGKGNPGETGSAAVGRQKIQNPRTQFKPDAASNKTGSAKVPLKRPNANTKGNPYEDGVPDSEGEGGSSEVDSEKKGKSRRLKSIQDSDEESDNLPAFPSRSSFLKGNK